MRIFISVSLLLFSITSFGNSRGRIIDNISRVASRVQIAVLDSELSNSELLEVQRELSDIVSRLNNRGGGSSVSCLEFTLDIFERRYSGSTALTKAQEACRKINDTALVEYVFNIFNASYTETTALDRAIDKTYQRNFRGKKALLEFVYEIYRQSYTPSTAIDRALDGVEPMPRNSFSCVEISYGSLSRSYTPSTAIRRALDGCMNN